MNASINAPFEDPQTGESVQPSEIAESQGKFDCKLSRTSSSCVGETKICPICKESFCHIHASAADSDCCAICIDYQSIETHKEPLIDDEGVKHEGAKITPIGLTYRTLTSRISQMSDYELERHIDHVRQQVKEAEMVLDYRRIDLAASQVELEERGVAKRKNLRMQSVSKLANGNKVVEAPLSNGEKKKAKALQDTAAKLKGLAMLLGLPCNTPEDIAKLAQKLQEMNKKK